MASNAYSDGRNAALARLVAGSKLRMTRTEWEQTGNLVAARRYQDVSCTCASAANVTYQNAEARAEFMRGWMSAIG